MSLHLPALSLMYLPKETVLPFRMSSMPSRMSCSSFGSDIISNVSFMLSYFSLSNVIVSAILSVFRESVFINFSHKRCSANY